MKRSYVIAGVLAVAAAAWIGSGQLGGADRVKEGQKPPANLSAAERTPSVRVRVQVAERRTSEIVLRGRTEAWRKVLVKAETHGRVEAVDVLKGSAVTAGDPLLQLAAEDRPARVREAQALLEQRTMEFEAARRLSEKGFRSETKLAESRAELERAQTALERAEWDNGNTSIAAPITGIVGERMVEVGDFVEMGDPVVKILDLDPVLAVAQISERNLARLRLGGPATVRLITGLEFVGNIRHIGAEADPATRTFRLEVELANTAAAIPDGITAELRIPAEQILAHRISPAILTLADDGQVGVKLLRADQTVEFRPVRIIGDDAAGLWVSGLPERVTLITVGQEFVAAGQTVQAVDEKTLQPFVAGDPS